MTEDIRKQLEGVNWERISMELAKEAYFHLNTIFRISGKQDMVPKGSTIEDVVQEAISRFYDPNRRNWEPERGELIPFLKGIVRSIVSHLADSAYNNNVDRRIPVETVTDHTPDTTTEELTDSVFLKSKFPSPFSCLQDKEDQETLVNARDLMMQRCEGNSDYEDVILAISDGEDKPREIAECTGLPIQRVYDLNKKWKKDFQEILEEIKAHRNVHVK